MPTYDDIWDGPGRNIKRVNGQPVVTAKWYVTIHNTSNDASAAQEADYAKVRQDGVGAHYFIDAHEVLQSTNTDYCVGHVGSTEGNSRGISYEITGVNAWTREQWTANVAWGQLAAVIARDCQHFGIPVRLLTIEQMRAFNADAKGFVTHDMCRQAWGGTTHTDPGPGFPMDHLMALVSQALGGDDEMQFTAQLQGNQACWLSNGMKARPIAIYDTLKWFWARGVEHIIFATEAEFLDRAGEKDYAGPEPVTLTPEQMAAIAAAASSGAQAGVAESADELAAELAPLLPAAPTADEVADAVVAEIAS